MATPGGRGALEEMGTYPRQVFTLIHFIVLDLIDFNVSDFRRYSCFADVFLRFLDILDVFPNLTRYFFSSDVI